MLLSQQKNRGGFAMKRGAFIQFLVRWMRTLGILSVLLAGAVATVWGGGIEVQLFPPAGGKVDSNEDYSWVDGTHTFSFTITASAGYVIKEVSGCDTPFADSGKTSASVKVTAGDADMVPLSVTFSAASAISYTVSVLCDPPEGGTVFPLTDSVAAGCNSRTFQFTPTDSNWMLADVTENGVSQGASSSPFVSNVKKDIRLVGLFARRYLIQSVATPGTFGSVTPSGSGPFPGGGTPTFTFTPKPGYGIKGVTVDGTQVAWTQGAGTASYTFTPLNANHTIEVLFDQAFTIEASAGPGGAITPSGSVPVVQGGGGSFAVVPASGFIVDNVIVDGSELGAISSYSFARVSANHVIRALFRPAGGSMKSYCNVPPFVVSNLKPNLLLMIDNSASMADLAYGRVAANGDGNLVADSLSLCFDDSYDNARDYVGYFDPDQIYSYDSAGGKFTAVSGMSGSCSAAGTGYLCVDMKVPVPPATTKTVQRFLASGRFLNWLAMSKLDVEKWVLTGGKVVSGLLQGESRGCQGKRFVKVAPEARNLTFALRGALNDDYDFSYQGSGTTRIEIFDKQLKGECRNIVYDWLNSDGTKLKSDCAACLGNSTEQYTNSQGFTTFIPSRASIFNLTINACFTALSSHSPFNDPSVLAIEQGCQGRFSALYSGDPNLVVASRVDDGICSSNLSHPLWNLNTTGFLGRCQQRWVGGFDSVCAKTEAEDYCHAVVAGQVTDPSATPSFAEGLANLPGFILDAGVSSLWPPSGTFLVRVAPGQSQGLVQRYGEELNLGAMVFNDNGSGSECSSSPGAFVPCSRSCSDNRAPCWTDNDCTPAGSCTADPATDGGSVISHIRYDPVGDHTYGLVAAIDSIKATSWTPLAESFYNALGYFAGRTDLRIALPSGMPAAWNPSFPPSQAVCQKNHILILSDGISSADRHPDMERLASLYGSGDLQPGYDPLHSCPGYGGSRSLSVLAWLARNRNIKSLKSFTASSDTPTQNDQYITTHAIFTGAANGLPGDCDPAALLRHSAQYGGGAFLSAPAPTNLYGALESLLQQISGRRTGTDASIVTTGTGNGALFLQEFFYPQVSFDNGATSASWIGEMEGLWYFIDPFLAGSTGQASSIRDGAGSGGGGSNRLLDLSSSNVVQFVYDESQKSSRARLYSDPGGSGTLTPSGGALAPESIQSIWRAGVKLWQRAPGDRTVYTSNGSALINLSSLDLSSEANRALLQAADPSQASQIISYTLGTDYPFYRNRTIAYPFAANNGIGVWKLGDIISSTPRVQGGTPLNSYHLPPPRGYGDRSYGDPNLAMGFTDSSSYRNRGTVYVGANDGMLHAIQMGNLSTPAGKPSQALLKGTDLGREEWGFIPRNALPYLTYLTSVDYRHLNYVDGSLTLVDAALGDPQSCDPMAYWDCQKVSTGWRTVLVGGMGLGGASRPFGDRCSDAVDTGSCVKAPVAGGGLSSYFALDVTDQTLDPAVYPKPPRLLWELSDPDLGFSLSGAAILRVQARGASGAPDPSRNGHWYAVFASGPTGPIDGNSCQFKGTSGQTLKIFVVELNALSPLTKGRNYWVIDTGIQNAFGGSLSGAGIDTDKWNPSAPGFYQDDAFYLGYTAQGSDGAWSDGGVIRVLTGEDPANPGLWRFSKVIDGIGPVTAAVAKLQDRKNQKLWLFFGTGRYFYSQDDPDSGRALFGVQDSCYRENRIDSRFCGPTLNGYGSLNDKSRDGGDDNAILNYQGWYIRLDGADAAAKSASERVVVDPSSLTSGAVYFTTYKPSSDPCSPEGGSFLWGVRYDTGGSLGSDVSSAASGQAAVLKGKALLRLSTGGVGEIPLDKNSFGDRDGRRSTGAMVGRAGGMRLIIASGLRPVKKILHIEER